ncbi:uncharacterized protein J3D65DRAFT_623673 [Phyllosticta citribraziliensis]|uniref:Secreted protein n=1 Tax=Phyllosticta citribraziliensis TaxID=989973 RepID=A0ABR1LQA6_9PEZI
MGWLAGWLWAAPWLQQSHSILRRRLQERACPVASSAHLNTTRYSNGAIDAGRCGVRRPFEEEPLVKSDRIARQPCPWPHNCAVRSMLPCSRSRPLAALGQTTKKETRKRKEALGAHRYRHEHLVQEYPAEG